MAASLPFACPALGKNRKSAMGPDEIFDQAGGFLRSLDDQGMGGTGHPGEFDGLAIRDLQGIAIGSGAAAVAPDLQHGDGCLSEGCCPVPALPDLGDRYSLPRVEMTEAALVIGL